MGINRTCLLNGISVFLFLSVHALSYSILSNDTLRSIPEPGSDFDIKNGALLAPILRPRVPGTPGSTAVLQHFVDFFKNSLPEWKLDFQNSTSTTPTSGGKDVPFVNLIATRDPPDTNPGEVGRLALVAHYDSLAKPEGFIGAIDSAAPCAMLLHAARSIDEALTQKWSDSQGHKQDALDLETGKGVQLIFMDGEEAFLRWTDTDSLYGARSLAQTWEQTPLPAMSTYQNPLETIELFLLLDLLGAKSPKIPSYFLTTHWAYQAMADAESRLRGLNQFKSNSEGPFLTESHKDTAMFTSAFIGDDHVPFMSRGVEILHIIPSHFPRVWHRIEDDGEHLDMDTVSDWTKLVTAFTAEWMELDPYMSKTPSRSAPNNMRSHDERPTGKTEL